ncbi:MAG TPA: substrate-binding domain-containing protein [Chthoniobacteraceae bacterium]|nr:substrate-binding domain-containing protein [Chthoniobacteraceae bacterium]
MKPLSYLQRGLVDLLLLLPLLFQLCLLAGVFAREWIGDGPWSLKSPWSSLPGILLAVGLLLFCCRCGRRLTRRFEGDGRLVSRYLPVIIPAGYTMLMALIAIFRFAPENGAVFGPFTSFFSLAHLTSAPIIFLIFIFSTPSPWMFIIPPLAIYLAYTIGLVLGFRQRSLPATPFSARVAVVAPFLVAFGLFYWRAHTLRTGVLKAERLVGYLEQAALERRPLERFQPLEPGNELVPIDAPGFTIASDHPRLDGATALQPVYAAAAQAIYAGVDAKSIAPLVACSKTPDAYRKLIAGEVDLIFVAEPSLRQRADAEAAGVALHLTPIGREAFIFFVHAENPVTGLTTRQIRDIYTRNIVNWSELGGASLPILPFQRPAGSGSQTALEQTVLKGTRPARALREEVVEGMGGVIQRVAAYRNSEAAIGYSFRFYATGMNPVPGIKLLAVDGVPPTRETIRNGSYPYTVDLYAVTAGSANPHVAPLVEWFRSPEGRKLIDETGYVSLP